MALFLNVRLNCEIYDDISDATESVSEHRIGLLPHCILNDFLRIEIGSKVEY